MRHHMRSIRSILPSARSWRCAAVGTLSHVLYITLCAASQVRLSATHNSPVWRQVAALQEWRASLWRLCHGSLTARGAPPATALRPEPLAHAWLRLRKALQGLAAAAPAAAALPEAAPLHDAASRMDRALGLDAGVPKKPYLWRAGGHPVPPPTHALCSAAARLAALAELTRARPSEWRTADPSHPSPAWEPRPDPAARLVAAGIELPNGALQLTNAAEEAAARESPAAAAAAALSADWALRQALLEGLGFFALAVQRLREGGVLGSDAPEVPESEALEIVQLLEGNVQARAREVRHPEGARALLQRAGPALHGGLILRVHTESSSPSCFECGSKHAWAPQQSVYISFHSASCLSIFCAFRHLEHCPLLLHTLCSTIC